MKKFFSRIIIASLLGVTFTIQSCNNEDSFIDSSSNSVENLSKASSADVPVKSEVIATFDSSALLNLKNKLQKFGVDVSSFQLDKLKESNDPTTKIVPSVKVIKVTTKTAHPNRLGGLIDVSGVLLLPPRTVLSDLTKYRIIVATPPTYTNNKTAPSNLFKDVNLPDNDFLAYWTLHASNGFIVFVPDYPGFGESYRQCQHPYLDSKSMVNSTLDLLNAAKLTLSGEGYRYKTDLIVTGYSLGGFVAASIGRKIETTPSLGLSVNLLLTGGTPCNLKQITDIVRNSEKTQHTYFLAYGLWGYKQNAYPNINIRDFLKEPYASTSLSYFDGTHWDIEVNAYFSQYPKEMYTEKFIKDLDTDPSLAYMNDILHENSVTPWVNKCRFIMTHGVSDVSVYYQNAYDFSVQQKKFGGKVTFISTEGDHIIALVPYLNKATFYTALYK